MLLPKSAKFVFLSGEQETNGFAVQGKKQIKGVFVVRVQRLQRYDDG